MSRHTDIKKGLLAIVETRLAVACGGEASKGHERQGDGGGFHFVEWCG